MRGSGGDGGGYLPSGGGRLAAPLLLRGVLQVHLAGNNTQLFISGSRSTFRSISGSGSDSRSIGPPGSSSTPECSPPRPVPPPGRPCVAGTYQV